MSILNGFKKIKKYKKIDNTNYQLQSQWTSADSVEMKDGTTLQETVDNLNLATPGQPSSGTGITMDKLWELLDENITIEQRRSIYRGKFLGSSPPTDAQYVSISDGSFKGFFIGDYWQDEQNVYRIADFDYYYGRGNPTITKHHLAIITDNCIAFERLHSETALANGIANCSLFKKMNGEIFNNFSETIFSKSHIMEVPVYLSTTVASNHPSTGAWYNAYFLIPTVCTILGYHWPGALNPIPGDLCQQLSLMRLNPAQIQSLNNAEFQGYWTEDINSNNAGVIINKRGFPQSATPTNSSVGVRPIFMVYAGE